MAKSYTFRELVKKLKKYDSQFEILQNRGKGSERMLFHPNINGRPESYPLKCHGEDDTIRKGHIKAVVRRFSLPKDFL